MCEFCTQHGEGRQWYLNAKNYAPELLHAELTADQQQSIQAASRYEWSQRFWEFFVMPAVRGRPPEKSPFAEFEPGSRPTETQVIHQNQVEHFGQVLPIEDVEQVIDRVDSITRMPCGCRYFSTGKADLRYCFGFGLDKWGVLGRFPEADACLEVLDRQEAKKIFRQYDAEGLMHSIWTGVTPFVVGMCNCDRDCGAYGGYITRRGAPNFFRAEYICRTDPELCTGCKACVSQCQFGAMLYSSTFGKVSIDPTRCFGCGVCRAACPTSAIGLIPRSQDPRSADLWLKHPAEARPD